LGGKVGFQDATIFEEAGLEKDGKSDVQKSASANPLCPNCGSKKSDRDGLRYLANGSSIQRWLCKKCAYRFSEKPPQKNQEWSINTQTNLISKRRICATDKEATNLTHATETKTVCVGDENQTIKGKLLQFALYMKLQGFSQATIDGWNQKLNQLSRNANLNDPEEVKSYLAFHSMSEASKHYFCTAYNSFLKWQGKTWVAPKYKGTQKIPEFIPTEQELDALIAGCGPKTATVLQTLKETGMRIGECSRLTWSCLNIEAYTLTLNTPEKNSLPRIFKISPKLVGMLQRLPKTSDRIFVTSGRHMGIGFAQQRKKIALKLGNPRLAKIHFHLIRHWKGTMEYHKTQNIIQVQRLLGHKSVLNTQLYVNLEQAIFEFNDQYEVKLAATVEEAVKLVEVGFEYVTEIDGRKLFRKRK
jgi:integrase